MLQHLHFSVPIFMALKEWDSAALQLSSPTTDYEAYEPYEADPSMMLILMNTNWNLTSTQLA